MRFTAVAYALAILFGLVFWYLVYTVICTGCYGTW